MCLSTSLLQPPRGQFCPANTAESDPPRHRRLRGSAGAASPGGRHSGGSRAGGDAVEGLPRSGGPALWQEVWPVPIPKLRLVEGVRFVLHEWKDQQEWLRWVPPAHPAPAHPAVAVRVGPGSEGLCTTLAVMGGGVQWLPVPTRSPLVSLAMHRHSIVEFPCFWGELQ